MLITTKRPQVKPFLYCEVPHGGQRVAMVVNQTEQGVTVIRSAVNQGPGPIIIIPGMGQISQEELKQMAEYVRQKHQKNIEQQAERLRQQTDIMREYFAEKAKVLRAAPSARKLIQEHREAEARRLGFERPKRIQVVRP